MDRDCGVSFFPSYAIYLQQKAPLLKIAYKIERINLIRKLKKLETKISYPRPNYSSEYELSILVLPGTSKTDKNEQIGFITGLSLGYMKGTSIYHFLSSISQKLKCPCQLPVRNIPAVDTVAASEGIEEVKLISLSYSEIMNMDIMLKLCAD